MEEEAAEIIKNAEKAKARVYDPTGNLPSHTNRMPISLIDEDYQMIDAHIDESIKH